MWAKCRKYAKIVQKNWGNFLQAWTRPDPHWCKFSSHTCAAVDAHFSLQLDPCRVFGVKIQNLNYNCLKTETLIMHHYSFQSYPCMCIVSVARTNIFKLHLALVKVWSVFCHLRFVQKFTLISSSDFRQCPNFKNSTSLDFTMLTAMCASLQTPLVSLCQIRFAQKSGWWQRWEAGCQQDIQDLKRRYSTPEKTVSSASIPTSAVWCLTQRCCHSFLRLAFSKCHRKTLTPFVY